MLCRGLYIILYIGIHFEYSLSAEINNLQGRIITPKTIGLMFNLIPYF
jgi:hypothetical protein